MAQRDIKLHITAAQYPFLFSEIGRTAIDNPPSETKSYTGSAAFEGAEGHKQLAVPQIAYIENCLPTSRGLKSVHLGFTVPEATTCMMHMFEEGAYQYFNVIMLDNGKELQHLVAIPYKVVDHWYLLSSGYSTSWATLTVPGYLAKHWQSDRAWWITHAAVRGSSYLCVPKLGVYTFQVTHTIGGYVLPLLVKADLKGISTNGASFIGVVASMGYLVAYDDDTIYYSSPSDATDFTPVLGGAGFTKLAGVSARIVTCAPTPDGFIVYTSREAIAAIATGNANFPFTFVVIPNCSGIKHPAHVGFSPGSEQHIALTNSGFATVTKTGSEPVFAEISDALIDRLRDTPVFEYIEEYSYDPAVGWSLTKANCEFYIGSEDDLDVQADDTEVRVSLVGGRYVIVSYVDCVSRNRAFKHREWVGQADNSAAIDAPYNAALVFDLALRRFGRLVCDHAHVAPLPAVSQNQVLTWSSQSGIKWSDKHISWAECSITAMVDWSTEFPFGLYNSWGGVITPTPYPDEYNPYNPDPNADVINMRELGPHTQNKDFFTRAAKVGIGRINVQRKSAVAIYEVTLDGVFKDTTVSRVNVQVIETANKPTKQSPLVYNATIPDSEIPVEITKYSTKTIGLRISAIDPVLFIAGDFHLSSVTVTVARSGNR